MKFIITSPKGKQKFRLEAGKTAVLGRMGGANDIAVDNPYVSSRHLNLMVTGDRLEVTDVGSSNGTYLNDQQLTVGKPYLLGKNQILYIGNSNVMLELVDEQNSGVSGQQGNSGQQASASGQAGAKKGLRALLGTKNEIFIGRSQECDLVINDPSVSRRHARVYNKGGQIYVDDLGSVNGVYINKTKVSSSVLKDNDTLYIGIHPFSLEKSVALDDSVSAISTRNITKVFSNGFKGLQETNLEIPEKKIVALMGPSGCGKSTLLKALNGDSPASAGTIMVFGQDLYENFDRLKHAIGYVPQDNIVHEDLTVDQSLYFAAKLRLPEKTSEDEIKTRITEVLQALKIDRPEIRANKVGKLSGGQKKRISIAVEILNKPKILFLDEPTSPLDPETIEEFLKCLQLLCEQEGTTVIMVTHKPEDLNYVDKVIFMGVGGHLVYDGTKEDIYPYFSKKNLIEVYALLASKDVSKSWYNKWRGQDNGGNTKPNPKVNVHPENINIFRQIYWLCARYTFVKLGNTKNLIIQFLQPIIIAVLLMMTFDTVINIADVPTKELDPKTMEPIKKEEKNGNVSIVFLLAIASVWFGVSNSAKEIVGEKEILKREFMFNMRLGNYLASKIVVLSVLTCLQVFILQSLVFIRFPDLHNFGLTFAYMSLIGISAIMYGLFFSSITSTSEEVMSVLPIALMPQIILSGLIQALHYVPTVIFSYFMIGRWGTEGLARIQDMNSNANLFMKAKIGVDKTFHDFLYKADNILTDITFRHNLIALFIISAIMLTAIYLILWSKLKSK